MREPDDDPAPEDMRLTELASIFAASILRLRHRIVWSDEESADGTKTCLEVPRETVLSGHHG